MKEKTARNIDIFCRYMVGERLCDIARRYEISPNRVRQIVGRMWRKADRNREYEKIKSKGKSNAKCPCSTGKTLYYL